MEQQFAILQERLASILLLSSLVGEIKTGLLRLPVCGPLYLQGDRTIWNDLSQMVIRLLGVKTTNSFSTERRASLQVRILGCDGALARMVN